MDLSLCLRLLTTAALLVAICGAPTAQVPFDCVHDVLGGGGQMRGIGGDAPGHQQHRLSDDRGAVVRRVRAARRLPLGQQPQDESGVFQARPGSYEFKAASYCLHAGTHGPGGGDGYLYGAARGLRSGAIRAILQGSVRRPDLRQQEIQVLLWAILARTPVDQMPRPAQVAATSLLTPRQLLELGAGSSAMMTPGIWDGGWRAIPPADGARVPGRNALAAALRAGRDRCTRSSSAWLSCGGTRSPTMADATFRAADGRTTSMATSSGSSRVDTTRPRFRCTCPNRQRRQALPRLPGSPDSASPPGRRPGRSQPLPRPPAARPT